MTVEAAHPEKMRRAGAGTGFNEPERAPFRGVVRGDIQQVGIGGGEVYLQSIRGKDGLDERLASLGMTRLERNDERTRERSVSHFRPD